jgi:hypothetical protein
MQPGKIRLSRRSVLAGLGGLVVAADMPTGTAEEVVKDIRDLKPGEFTWHPERQPDGPVAVVVSLPEQRVHVYRNGIRIAVSTCSSGKPGHETPTGVFVVLQKDRDHHSSTYNDAPMPNMNRLTWSGIALHAGNLPGYPASHGCVRLPMDFSAKLFTVTHIGTPVIIAGSHTDPWDLVHPGLVLAGYTESEFKSVVTSLDGKTPPTDWQSAQTNPVTSVVASSAAKGIMLLENGDTVAEDNLTIKGNGPLGSHVLVLVGADQGKSGMRWSVISHQDGVGTNMTPDDLVARLSTSQRFIDQMSARMHPGMVLILTDAPLTPDRRTGDDFVIMS